MDNPSRLTLRIFISAPGDVPVERDRAADIVAGLHEEFVHYAVLVPFFWEDEPVRATGPFQSQFPEAGASSMRREPASRRQTAPSKASSPTRIT